MNVEISEGLWNRIEHYAKLFKKTPEQYFLNVLEHQVPQIPDPERAEAEINKIREEAGPEDDYDIDEFLRAIEENRGRGIFKLSETNGVPR